MGGGTSHAQRRRYLINCVSIVVGSFADIYFFRIEVNYDVLLAGGQGNKSGSTSRPERFRRFPTNILTIEKGKIPEGNRYAKGLARLSRRANVL